MRFSLSSFVRWISHFHLFQTVFVVCLLLTSPHWLETTAFASGPLTASQAHGLMLATNNTVCSVGENSYGQLGDGTEVDRLTPVTAARVAGVVGVATGWYHSLAVLSDGSVWSWGYNNEGELGDGSTSGQPTPMLVPNLSGVIAVAAGQYHSLALKNDGTVWAWGYNANGRLGDGTQTQRLTPVQVITTSGPLTGVSAIAAGQSFSMALKSDGTVWTWGYNGDGELGVGTFVQSVNPVQVTGLSQVTSIAAGTYHALSLKTDGTVWTWGYNGYGQLGDGSTTSRPNIVRATGLTGVIGVAGGTYHSVAVKSDGTVWAWGYNGNGQLGDGTLTQHLIPNQASGLSTASAVAAGDSYSEALTSGGMYAWGANTHGQLGNGSTTQTLLPVAATACTPLPGNGNGLGVQGRIAAGQNHSMAIKSDGTIAAWGSNSYGELGDGTTIARNTPVQTVGISGAVFVATGWYHGLAAVSSGAVWSWGYNADGELGDGTRNNRSTPLAITGLTGIIAVAAGQYHSLALKNDGTVWAWGYNSSGRLGDGSQTERISPVQVVNLTGITAIAAGQSHSMALKSDGTVWTWGYNGYGQLGNGTFTQSVNAIQVPGLTGVIAIAAGANHSLALRNDGTVWAWGYDAYGQLGDGGSGYQTQIVRASDLTNVIGISGGTYHSLAVKSDGSVWAWGYNADGQLGDATTATRTTPVHVTALTTALAVAAGDAHSLAILNDGSAWAWGSNSNGQFGAALPANSTVPVKTIAGGLGVVLTPASITSPTAGTRLASTTVTFTWTAISGADAYWLDVGTSAASGNICAGQTAATSSTCSGIPTSATTSTIYVQVWTHYNGTWYGPAPVTYLAPLPNLPSPPTITSPLPGSQLPGTSVTFTWTAVAGADAYWLDVGTAFAQGNICAGQSTSLSSTCSNIPTAGTVSTIYVQLWTHYGGSWTIIGQQHYTYVPAGATAVLTSPTPGSVLGGSSVTFSWTAAAGASQYWLDVGNSLAMGDISAGATLSTSKTVSNLPCDSRTIYVQLWTMVNGSWLTPNRYTFTACSGTGIISPTPGSVLSTPSATFTWNTVPGADQYWLDVGSQVATGDYYGNPTTATAAIVNNLPCDGRTVYVQLWAHVGGGWQAPQRYTYTAGSGCAALTSPAGSFNSTSMSFTWNAAAGADQYWLDVGNSIGQGDIYGASTAGTSATVTNLPCDGRTIYVQLWTHIGGGWRTPGRYIFTAWGVCGRLASPIPGSTLPGSTVNFAWTAGTGASAYWLDVGTVLGQGNIFGSNVGTALSQVVSGIPTNGSPIYVQLWSQIGGVWYLTRYNYTAFH